MTAVEKDSVLNELRGGPVAVPFQSAIVFDLCMNVCSIMRGAFVTDVYK
jgi:hypothetical protein